METVPVITEDLLRSAGIEDVVIICGGGDDGRARTRFEKFAQPRLKLRFDAVEIEAHTVTWCGGGDELRETLVILHMLLAAEEGAIPIPIPFMRLPPLAPLDVMPLD